MAGTQINQQRQTVVVSGTNKYTVTTTCTVEGTLQDTGIFLLDILNTVDPKDDTFNRIVEIADITTYLTDRDAAVQAGDASWRASSSTLIYDDIAVANAAWKELTSRINTLVDTYDTYLTEFETFTAGTVISFPTVDESAKNVLKTDYTAADTALTTAQTALTDKIPECTQLETDLAVIEDRLQEAQADLAVYTPILSSLAAINAVNTGVYNGLFAANGQIRTLNNGSDADAVSYKDPIESQLRGNDANLAQFSAENAALASLISGGVTAAVSTLQTRVVTLTQNKNTKFTDLNKCHTETSKLQADVTTAAATRSAALAAVVAVCPDFTP